MSRFDFFNPLIKVPILFLVLSTFGFLFSTLVYANATGEIARRMTGRFSRHMVIGNVISEYIGVYLLVLAVPLVIYGITADAFIRLSTLVATLSGLAVYHLSGTAVISRHFPKSYIAILGVLIVAELILVVTVGAPTLYQTVSLMLIFFLVSLAGIAFRRGE